ncbi:MAG: MBL fold metallo-hydrolase [Myxococcota bacterium]
MLEACFLGHQGWLLSSASTRVLVDPLLTDRFGHGGGVGVVHPPRRIDLSAFPPVDAVILSHEHDDHFDVPSIHRLDRRIPIHLSSRASNASRALLRDMGFTVHPLRPNATLAVGDLRYRSFVADHVRGPVEDEWGVFPFLLYDTGGHGSVLSAIDVEPRDDGLAQLGRLAPPGLWCYANNTTDSRFQDALRGPSAAPPTDDTPLLARVVARRHAQIEQAWGHPLATLVGGAGWAFEGDRAWINHHAFPIDPNRLCEALARACPSASFTAPVPGETFVQHEGRLLAERPRAPFIAVPPRSQWPTRTHDPTVPVRDHAPVLSGRAFGEAQLQTLIDELGDFARYLYGGAVFRALQSLTEDDLHGRRCALAIALRRADGPPYVLRYEPEACGFTRQPSTDAIEEFASGLECWGADLLGLMRGELGVSALCFAGRMRVWNHAPRRLRWSPHDLWMFGHPLRRPAAATQLYRVLRAQLPESTERVRFSGSAPVGRPD